jgi:hypothetical protein
VPRRWWRSRLQREPAWQSRARRFVRWILLFIRHSLFRIVLERDRVRVGLCDGIALLFHLVNFRLSLNMRACA